MNYRSVIVLGRAQAIEERQAKLAAMRALVERIATGRWERVRQPSERELRATKILAVPLDEASAKVRTGPPLDDQEDLTLPVWAGIVPLATAAGEPERDPGLDPLIEAGPDVADLLRRVGGDSRPGCAASGEES